MRLLYNNVDGKIFYAVYNRDWFMFKHTTNILLTELYIDELVENQATCQSIVESLGKYDANMDAKYYMAGAALMSKDGWIEAPLEIL